MGDHKSTSHEQGPYDDFEMVLASVGHSLVAQGMEKEAILLSKSHCFVEYSHHDNWNGGTSVWNLVIEVEYPTFVAYSSQEREKLEQFINQVIEDLQPDGDWISTKIKALPINDTGWRQNINKEYLALPSRSLEKLIKDKDVQSIEAEFDRALKNIDAEPREAVSASCNILESIFKVYILDEKLPLPKKQDIQSIWKIVRDDLGFETSRVEDDDLKKIISGLLSIVGGIGAFRTHASSAHGQGRNPYRIKPRHARLAVHSAHTLSMFVLESWNEKNSKS